MAMIDNFLGWIQTTRSQVSVSIEAMSICQTLVKIIENSWTLYVYKINIVKYKYNKYKYTYIYIIWYV